MDVRFIFTSKKDVLSELAKQGKSDGHAVYTFGTRFLSDSDTTLSNAITNPGQVDQFPALTRQDLFGKDNTVTVFIDNTLLKTVNGGSSILAHEFHEIYSLFVRTSGGKTIDRLDIRGRYRQVA